MQTTRINFRCDQSYYHLINRYAKLENMTVSAFIRKVTIEYINDRRKADNEMLRRKLPN